jgi:hypothetical protein
MDNSEIKNDNGEYLCHQITSFSDMEWASRWRSDNGGQIKVVYPDSSFLCSIVKGMGTFSTDDHFEVWFADEEEPRSRVSTDDIMKEIETKYLVWYERNNEFKTISNENNKHRR